MGDTEVRYFSGGTGRLAIPARFLKKCGMNPSKPVIIVCDGKSIMISPVKGEETILDDDI